MVTNKSVTFTTTSTPGTPTGVVISQVYGGGGNTGAPLTQRLTSNSSIAGNPGQPHRQSVQYASADGHDLDQPDAISSGILSPRPVLPRPGGRRANSVPAPRAGRHRHHRHERHGGQGCSRRGHHRLDQLHGPGGCGSRRLREHCVLLRGVRGPRPRRPTRPPTSGTETGASTRTTTRPTSRPARPNRGTPRRYSATARTSLRASPAPLQRPVPSDVPVTRTSRFNFSEAVNVARLVVLDLVRDQRCAHRIRQSGGPQSFTLNPDTDFVANETLHGHGRCDERDDQDANDPPDDMSVELTAGRSRRSLRRRHPSRSTTSRARRTRRRRRARWSPTSTASSPRNAQRLLPAGSELRTPTTRPPRASSSSPPQRRRDRRRRGARQRAPSRSSGPAAGTTPT